jgi:predicted dehydrogenase
MEVSWMLHHNVGDDVGNTDSQLWLYGTKAGAHWPTCEIYEANYKTQQHYNRKLQIKDSSVRAHARECIEFARAITTGGPSPVPAEQSLQVMAILDGIYKSQETGREVRLRL